MRLDSAALVQVAADAGYEITARMLEMFRTQGLLPRPERTGQHGRKPVWTSPPGTDHQLVSLMGWRERTKDVNALRTLLWLDGFPVEPDIVRNALIDGIQHTIDQLNREVTAQAVRDGLDPETGADRDDALGRLAARLAAKRGHNAIARRTRVSATGRADAVHLMLRAFGLGEQTVATTEEAMNVERVFGLVPGRRDEVDGAGPWLTGPAEDLFAAAEHVAPPAAQRAVAECTELELETARHIVAVLFRYLPLAARMLAVLFDDENYAGLAALSRLDHHPEIVVQLVPAVIGMLRAGLSDNLTEIVAALDSMPELVTQTHELLDLPQQVLESNLDGQSVAMREQVDRIIEAGIDGAFDRPSG